MFFNCDIARLNFTHTDHAALAYRSIEPPFIKVSSYASEIVKHIYYCIKPIKFCESNLHSGNTPAIKILSDQEILNVNRGDKVELSISVECEDPKLKYQWEHRKEGASKFDIISNDNVHYEVKESKLIVKEEHEGYYHCKVKSLAGESTSENFHVTIRQGEHLCYITHIITQ
jgi:hypothetical protein